MPYKLSKPSPVNTKRVPSHCLEDIGFWKIITEPRMVKNLRVVVTMEQVSGPNLATVMKMNVWKRKKTMF